MEYLKNFELPKCTHAVGVRPFTRLARDCVRRYFFASRDCVSWYLFASMASAAESFRSMCGSGRSPSECNKQRSPAATPHVGQGTEEACSGVRSIILTGTASDNSVVGAAPFGTVSENRSDKSHNRTWNRWSALVRFRRFCDSDSKIAYRPGGRSVGPSGWGWTAKPAVSAPFRVFQSL